MVADRKCRTGICEGSIVVAIDPEPHRHAKAEMHAVPTNKALHSAEDGMGPPYQGDRAASSRLRGFIMWVCSYACQEMARGLTSPGSTRWPRDGG